MAYATRLTTWSWWYEIKVQELQARPNTSAKYLLPLLPEFEATSLPYQLQHLSF